MARGIPLTKGLDLTSFLVDMGTIGDWNLDGLPTDPLSIQNGILVSKHSPFRQTRQIPVSLCTYFRADISLIYVYGLRDLDHVSLAGSA